MTGRTQRRLVERGNVLVYQLEITLLGVEPAVWRHNDMVRWAGHRFDPEAFDFAAVNRKLRLLR